MALSTSPSHSAPAASSTHNHASSDPSSLPLPSCSFPATNSSISASSCGMVGNDRLDPARLTLNNGINHGDFIIGPPVQPVNGTPVKNISEYIAKREGTDEFVVLKVLNTAADAENNSEEQGKMLLYNELSILSLLQDQPGVIHQHGFFRERNHFILVLDCLIGHEYDKEGRYKHFENLQHYVIREKKLCEREALEVFSSALTTVDALHQKNIVHRDLKLGNMILNRRTREVILTNFVLSKHLVRDDDELMDQRGSLAYVSPDVLSGQPYCGKASDMWAMGVLLYTMIYGQFPFYDNDPQELFRKIKTARYTIPRDNHVSMATVMLIKELMEVDTKKRITARCALDTSLSILSRVTLSASADNDSSAQIVPDMEDKLHSSDITMAMKTEGLATGSTAVQLNLSPINPDSHSSHVRTPVHPVAASFPFQGSPVHVATSPVHAGPIPFQGSPVHVATSPTHTGPISFHTSTLNGQQLILNSDLSSAYLLTPLAPSLSGTTNGAFLGSPSNGVLNASPTHSLQSSSPINIPTSPPSNSHSLPIPSGGGAYHRPVGPSQSVDSYFTSQTLSSLSFPPRSSASSHTTSHVRPTALFSPQSSCNILLPSVSETGRDSENISSFVVSSPVNSIVTVGNLSGASHTQTHSHPPPYRRRNSSGDLHNTRVRRSSQGGLASPSASLEGTSLASHTHIHHGRPRRRSQDGQRSRASSREPYTLNPL